MKINFILPNIYISGGVKAVFEFANQLHARGHEVFVTYPLIPSYSAKKGLDLRAIKRGFEKGISNYLNGQDLSWFNLKANLLRVPSLAERYIVDADIVVATWWETARIVSSYNESKGDKFYLVQHYEIWGGQRELVDESYKLGLHNVVNSSWLKNILENELRVNVDALIMHSPDKEHFYPEKSERHDDKIRILMAYRNIKWKGMEYGIEAFEILKKKYSNIELVMFGPAKDNNVPTYAQFHEKPSNDDLRRIYNSCDIFLFPSLCEGFGMPPMEAMLCKCAVVTTDVGAIVDYTTNGKNALVCPPGSSAALAEKLEELITNKNLREQIANSGYENISQNYSWEKAAEELEDIFQKVLNKEKLHEYEFIGT